MTLDQWKFQDVNLNEIAKHCVRLFREGGPDQRSVSFRCPSRGPIYIGIKQGPRVMIYNEEGRKIANRSFSWLTRFNP